MIVCVCLCTFVSCVSVYISVACVLNMFVNVYGVCICAYMSCACVWYLCLWYMYTYLCMCLCSTLRGPLFSSRAHAIIYIFKLDYAHVHLVPSRLPLTSLVQTASYCQVTFIRFLRALPSPTHSPIFLQAMLHEEQVKSCHSLAHSPPWLLSVTVITAFSWHSSQLSNSKKDSCPRPLQEKQTPNLSAPTHQEAGGTK